METHCLQLSVDHVIVMSDARLDRKSYLQQFKYNFEADAIEVDSRFRAADDVFIVS